jgi:hypothetical protein
MVMIPNAPRVGDMPTNTPVPEAIYHLRLDKATYKTTGSNAKTPGAPMAECQFTIFGPAEAEEFHGRKIFENLMLDGSGMFRVRQLLEATGENEDFVLEDTDQLVGRECAAAVQEEKEKTIDGKRYDPRNKIARFMPLEG